MRRLLIVSNRLPVSVEKRGGEIHFSESAGGLATGLRSFYRSYDCTWIGWPGITSEKLNKSDRECIEAKLKSEYHCQPVYLTKNDFDNYYLEFCNKTMWPLCHYFTEYVVYEKNSWEAYERANTRFCSAILDSISSNDDITWVHDFHLMLVPDLLRAKRPDATIGFFFHIPFPSFEVFRLLPWRKEILQGLLGADVIGFHTYDYARHFLSCVHRLLGYDHDLGQIFIHDRTIKVDVFPMGIDYEQFSGAAQKPEVKKEIIKFRRKIGDRKVILSIDRLDYTKGIPQRLKAFDTFLSKHPEYKGKITLLLVAVPSRMRVHQYQTLKESVDELIGNINGNHGTIGWVPIWYFYRSIPFHTLAALYNIADIAMVTPLRDGMNLIAKEYIASKIDRKGVLILSEMAGAAKELGEAIVVNPYDHDSIVFALEKAFAISEEVQIAHNTEMQERLKRYDVRRWAEEFIGRLIQTKTLGNQMKDKLLDAKSRRKLTHKYKESMNRLLLLDYDGTLVPFYPSPELASPDKEILEILKNLTANRKNEVVIISGRDKDTLETWFRGYNLGLIAEHGALIKESTWELIEPLSSDWKEKIRPILELYQDRTPGSLVEEKEFSLVWHYRSTDHELGLIRAREIIDDLVDLTANLSLEILEGHKVVEVKNSGINKGRAGLRLVQKKDWDYILSIGDDWTDEDLFQVLPDEAYSIRVGFAPTNAKYRLQSYLEVRALLSQLISEDSKSST